MKVREVMSVNVITVGTDATIEDIARVLTDNKVSGAPVVDRSGKMVGIVTQKDLLYKDIQPRFPAVVELLGGLIFLKGVRHYNEELKKLVATKAEDIMTKDVVTIDADADIQTAATLMVEKDINRIPVVENGRLAGIVGRADIVRSLAGG